MAKISIKCEKLTPFGGIFHVYHGDGEIDTFLSLLMYHGDGEIDTF